METFVLKMYLNVVLVLFGISMQCTIVSNVISIRFFFFCLWQSAENFTIPQQYALY